MTYTIWSNAGRYEWIIRDGDAIVARSGLIYPTRSRAQQKLILELNAMGVTICRSSPR
jgi:hypothetical protein